MSLHLMSPLMTQVAEKVDVSTRFLETLNLYSVFDISKQRKSAFLHKMSNEGISRDIATDLYERACGYANQLANIYRHQRHKFATLAEAETPTWESLFNEDWLTFCDEHHLDSNQGPVAYVVELFGYAQELDAMGSHKSLLERRPDLQNLVLDEANTYQQVPMLELVNEMLAARINEGEDIDTVMATTHQPAPLPYDNSVQRIELALKDKQTDYSTVCQLLSEQYPLWHENTKDSWDSGKLSMNTPVGHTIRGWLKLDKDNETHTPEYTSDVALICQATDLDMDVLREATRVSESGRDDTYLSPNVPPKGGNHTGSHNFGASYISGKSNTSYRLKIRKNGNRTYFVTSSQHDIWDHGAFDRLHRMVRLHHATSLPFLVLDTLARTYNSNLSVHILRATGLIEALRTRKIDFDAFKFCSFFNNNATQYGLQTQAALFDQWFNPTPDQPVLSIVEQTFINPWLNDSEDTHYEENWFVCNRICEGFNITIEDLKALCLQGVEEGVPLNFTVAWARYFHELVYLAELLNMPLRALLALLPMMSGTHEQQLQSQTQHSTNRDAYDVIMDLLTFSDWLKTTELDVINVLQWLTPANALTISLTDSKAINLVRNVQRQLPSTLLRVTDLIAAGLPTQNSGGDITIAEWESALLAHGILYHDNQGVTVTPLEPVATFEAAWNTVFSAMNITPDSTLLETMNGITLSCFDRQNQLLSQELSVWLGCSASTANKLLSWVLTPTVASTTMDTFLHSIITIDSSDVLPTDFIEVLYDMTRHKSVAVDYFALSDFSLGKLIEGGLYGGARPSLNLALLYHLSRYQELLALTGDEESLWFGVQGSFTDDKARSDYLAELMGWESSEIQHLFEAFTGQASSGAMTMVELLHRYQAMSKKLNLNVSQLLSVRTLNHDSTVAQWREVGDIFAISDKATQ